MKLVVVALVALPVLVPRLGAALTMADCQDWLQQLQGEVAGIEVSGSEGASERDAMLEDLKKASRGKGTKPTDSRKQIDEFRKRADKLAKQGRVAEMEGTRLQNLSDTVLHCIDQVEQGEPREEQED